MPRPRADAFPRGAAPLVPFWLAAVAKKSTSLRQASSKYSKDAKYLNTQALLRKYAPVAVVTVLIGGGLWWRFF